mmetsp:Transcript_16449/g.37943  ORF Transcript_16449/g.37943 Transcript_16449/m.37943 type:complete len:201 (+) Transcript_16449:176-778(+)
MEGIPSMQHSAVIEHYNASRVEPVGNLRLITVQHLTKDIQGLVEVLEQSWTSLCSTHFTDTCASHTVVEVYPVLGRTVDCIGMLKLNCWMPSTEIKGISTAYALLLPPDPAIILELYKCLRQDRIILRMLALEQLCYILTIGEDVLSTLTALHEAMKHLNIRRSAKERQVGVQWQPMGRVSLVVRIDALIHDVEYLTTIV